MLTVMAAIAEFERKVISDRTRRALAELKAQGVTLGRPVELDPSTTARIQELRDEGHTYKEIADQLNRINTPTATGKGKWSITAIRRVLLRAAEQAAAEQEPTPEVT